MWRMMHTSNEGKINVGLAIICQLTTTIAATMVMAMALAMSMMMTTCKSNLTSLCSPSPHYVLHNSHGIFPVTRHDALVFPLILSQCLVSASEHPIPVHVKFGRVWSVAQASTEYLPWWIHSCGFLWPGAPCRPHNCSKLIYIRCLELSTVGSSCVSSASVVAVDVGHPTFWICPMAFHFHTRKGVVFYNVVVEVALSTEKTDFFPSPDNYYVFVLSVWYFEIANLFYFVFTFSFINNCKLFLYLYIYLFFFSFIHWILVSSSIHIICAIF